MAVSPPRRVPSHPASGGAPVAPRRDVPRIVRLWRRLVAPRTDQPLSEDQLHRWMVRNAVLLLANGAACAKPPQPDDLEELKVAIREVCQDLARAIPADGEGATHLVTLDIEGAPDRDAARQIARTIAESPLVKTAVAGADPNWGRIVSAAGYAQVPLEPTEVSLWINGTLIYEHGSPVTIDDKAVSNSIRENRETNVRLVVGQGSGATRFWTTDLTAEYVRLNADYRT